MKPLPNKTQEQILEDTEARRLFFHDILNTAGNIRNYAQLLLSADEEEIAHLASALMRLSETLVDEIHIERKRFRAEVGMEDPDPILVDTSNMVKELAEIYNLMYAEKGIAAQVDINYSQRKVPADPVILRRVLVNLLDNAFKTSQPGDTITLNQDVLNDNLILTVHNPTYIPPDLQEQLLHPRLKPKAMIHGMGAYSIRRLTETELKGRVDFESTPEKGTRFSLVLPLES